MSGDYPKTKPIAAPMFALSAVSSTCSSPNWRVKQYYLNEVQVGSNPQNNDLSEKYMSHLM